MMNSISSEWIADYKCHLALSFDQNKKKDVEENILLLMEASSALFLNKNLLKDANLLLKQKGVDVIHGSLLKRTLLNCLAVRCYLIEEKKLSFLDIDDCNSSLPPALSALNLARQLVESSSGFDLLTHVIFLTLKFLEISNFDHVLLHSLFKTYSKFFENKNDLPNICSDFSYHEYIYSIMIVFNKLNKCLDKPLLIKIKNQLLNDNAITAVDDMDKNKTKKICHLITDSFQVLSNLKKNSSFSNSINIKNNYYEFLTQKSCSSVSSSSDKTSFSKVKIKVQKSKQKIIQVQKPLRRKWTLEEDALIIKSIKTNGFRWCVISKLQAFSGNKSGTQIRDRWRTILSKGLVTLDSFGNIEKFDSSYNSFM